MGIECCAGCTTNQQHGLPLQLNYGELYAALRLLLYSADHIDRAFCMLHHRPASTSPPTAAHLRQTLCCLGCCCTRLGTLTQSSAGCTTDQPARPPTAAHLRQTVCCVMAVALSSCTCGQKILHAAPTTSQNQTPTAAHLQQTLCCVMAVAFFICASRQCVMRAACLTSQHPPPH